MAKSNFGLRRGSTKSFTFQVNNGKQITKDRVIEVKNPRTPKQMRQRAYTGTIGRAYSVLSKICDHSFENVAYGFESMNVFKKLNYKILLEEVSTSSARISSFDGDAVCNKYQISKGSLPKFIVFHNGTTEDDTTFSFPYVLSEKTADNLTLADVFDYDETKKGFIYTLAFFVESLAGTSMLKYIRFDSSKVNMESKASTWRSLSGVEHNLDPSETITFGVSTGMITVKISYGTNGTDGFIVGAGCIVSAQIDGKWLRSDCVMDASIVSNVDSALNSYPTGTEYLLNG